MTKQRDQHQAVALRYRVKEDPAPRLVAKGSGVVADRIIEAAQEHGVPVRQDRNLVQVLSLLDLNQEIPPAVYRAVAEILAFVYGVGEEKAAEKRSS
jgi:flagellar biosynthesis protein